MTFEDIEQRVANFRTKKSIIWTLKLKHILYVQEVVTQPKILNRTILYNLVHVT